MAEFTNWLIILFSINTFQLASDLFQYMYPYILINRLNEKSVQSVLGVDREWEQCNYDVNGMFANDWMKNFENQIPALLEDGIKVLIYAGDLDL